MDAERFTLFALKNLLIHYLNNMPIQLTSFRAYNLRKIGFIEVDATNAAVILIKGANEVGKSTLMEAMAAQFSGNNTTELIGGNNAWTEGDYILPSGEKVLLKQDLSAGVKGSRFTLINQEGKPLKSGVNDIKDLFKYNAFTIEEFIAKGEFAEGRRFQRNIVLNILPQATKDTFLMLEADEKELYEKRTAANNAELIAKNVVEKARPSAQDKEKAKTIGDIEKQYLDAEKKHLEAYTTLQNQKQALIPIQQENAKLSTLRKEYDDKVALYRDKDKFYSDEIAELERKLEAKKKEKEAELNRIKQEGIEAKAKRDEQVAKCDQLQSIDLTELEKDERGSKAFMLELKQKYDDAKQSVTAMSNYFKQVHEYKEAKAVADKLDEEIKRVRRDKEEVILNSEFPLKDVRITDEGIEVFVDDKWLPCSKSHIATSRLYCTVGKIAVLANKNFPVALLSQGESVLSERMQWLVDFANENDAIFIVEKAVEGYDEVVCEVIEK